MVVDTREVEAYRLFDLCFGDERVAEAYEEAARHCEAFPENVYTLYYEGEGKFYCVEAPIEERPLCLLTVDDIELAHACCAAIPDDLEGCVPRLVSGLKDIFEKRRQIEAVICVRRTGRILFKWMR